MSLFLGQSVGPIAFGTVSAATGLPVAVVCTGLLLAGLGAMAAYAIRRA
jgi:hypothetical protein